MRSLLRAVLSAVCVPAFASSGWAAPQSSDQAPASTSNRSAAWDLKKASTLVTFGSSSTDNGRINYFISHGAAPPPGYTYPPNNNSADGGHIWADYAGWYTGARLYDYATSGAVCSNNITPHGVPGFGLFPDVQGYQIPAYLADSKFVLPNGTKFFHGPADSTVYSMWIGVNDIGPGTLLTDSQVPGTNITTYLDCIYQQLGRLYNNGARYFVLQNQGPYYLSPMEGLPQYGGIGPNKYWLNKAGNITEIGYKVLEYMNLVNYAYKYRTPYEVLLAKSFPGARFAVMDMYGLLLDIHDHPHQYLNGTAPPNVSGYVQHCSLTNLTDCVHVTDSPDSYLWYDELHFTEQVNRVIAKTFTEVIQGTSKWATYWAG